MDCIRCHRDIPDTSAYCLYCGKRQAQALRSIIGHASYSTTVEIYAHANLPELKEELAKISGLSQNGGEEI